jgi:hypothetical protein
VTRDDIRRLMGAYATGSLTDTDRKALFEAALDDQDLFDELAREQAMKEVLDEPGVRERLIAGLPPVDSEPVAAAGGWRKPLAWGLSAAFVLSMSIAAVVITRSTDTRQASQKVATLDGQPAATAPATTAPEPIPQSASAPQSTPARVAGAPAPSSERPAQPGKQAAGAKKIEPSGFASGRLEPAKPADNRDENRPAKDVKELDKAVSTQPAAAPIPAPPPPITNSPREARRAQPTPLPTSSFAPGTAPNPAPSPTSNSTTGGTVSQDQGRKDQGQKDQGQAGQASDSSKPKQASDQVAVTATTGQVDPLRAQNAQINTGQINTGQINNGPAENSRSKAAPQLGVAAGRGGAEAKTSSVAAPRPATPAASGGGGGARGLVGGSVGGLGTTRRPAHFAFDYKIEDEDLTLKFAADGYVSIHFVPGGITVVGVRVTAGSTRHERIPANATEVNLLFTAAPQPGAPGVSLTKEPKDVRSGTVEDPAGARIDLLLRFY